MAKLPKDQFDDYPADLSRVGAHRAPVPAGRGWVTVAWAALATGIIVALGVLALTILKDQSFFGGVDEGAIPTISATPTADPVVDPTTIDPARNITITILNGTTTIDLDKVAATKLTGWPIGATLNAATRNEETTVVYYSNPDDEDVARGVVLALGVGEIRESTAYIGAPVTVVVGADFAPPAASSTTP
jgi:hypothetical protein